LKTVTDIPRKLNKENIDNAIETYKSLLNEIPLRIEGSNILELLTKLKRDKINFGPWKNVSIFEAANRIMTDLIILYGIKQILDGTLPHLNLYKEFDVELGNENKNLHDIVSYSNGKTLIGEAFNVAPSFFNVKKGKSIKKLVGSISPKDHLVILCNSDSHTARVFKTSTINEIEIIRVDVSCLLR